MRQLEPKRTLIIIACLGLAGVTQNTSAESSQVEIVAADMCCKGCVQKVAGQLYTAPGVTKVDANLETRTVIVTIGGNKRPSLEQLWQAVVTAKGGPTKLSTQGTTFTLTPPAKDQALPAATSYVVVEDLNFEGRAQKIGKNLHAIRGVQKVGMDAQQNTLIVSGEQLSPWTLIGAVTSAQSRPLLVKGSYGEMRIEWLQNQQAYQPNHGGIQK